MTFFRFRPWKGANYEQGWHGVRTLIVGESHYSGRFDCGEELTQSCVREWASTGKGARFWAAIERTMLGDLPANRVEFWDSVGFYNYVQDLLLPHTRPRVAHLRAGQLPFLRALRSLQPELVVIYGKDVWNKGLPPHTHRVANWREGDEEVCGYQLPKTGHIPLVLGNIPHPRGGHSHARWYPVIRRARDFVKAGRQRMSPA